MRFSLRLLTGLLLLLSADAVNAQLVIGSYFDSSVYQYSPTGGGLQNTFYSNGSNGLSGPAGVTVGPDHNLYFSSQFNNSVLKYNPTTGVSSTFIDSATLSALAPGYSPAGLKFGPDGNLYLTRNMGNFSGPFVGAIDRFSPSGAFIDTPFTGLSQPVGLTVQGNDLYVSERIGPNQNGYGSVTKIANFTGGSPVASTFVTTQSGLLENPTGTAWGPDGKFYVADVGGSSNGVNCAIRRYNSDGTFDAIFNQTPLAFQFPSDVLFRDDGKLFVANIGLPADYYFPGSPGFPGSVAILNANGSFDSNIVNGSNVFPAAMAFNPVAEPALLGLAGLLLVLRRRF